MARPDSVRVIVILQRAPLLPRLPHLPMHMSKIFRSILYHDMIYFGSNANTSIANVQTCNIQAIVSPGHRFTRAFNALPSPFFTEFHLDTYECQIQPP
jgi:hypothetical protein